MSKLVTALAVAALGSGALQAAPIARNAIAQGDAVFVTAADGTLAALDATSGAVRWSSPTALRPLAVQAARVLAQAEAPTGRLGLVVLEARTGRLLARSSVTLPAGVTTPLDDTGDTRFAIAATADGARVRLEWTWDFQPMRGLYEEEAEEAEREARGPRHAEGALLVDLASASGTPVASRRASGPPTLPAVLAREADGGAFRERPLAAGAFLVATQARGDALVLKRWRGGSAQADVSLAAGSTLQLASAEGGHVLVSRELSDAPLEAAHEWTVVALDTGARVATLRTSTAAAGFAVAADRVLVAHEAWEHRTPSGWRREPRRVEAFDRATGALAWTREIRDGRYTGPVAP